MMRTEGNFLDFAGFRPQPAEGESKESPADLVDKITPGDAAAGIDRGSGGIT
jgi:hypothetical protein